MLGIHKEDKQKIKQLLHHFLADLYFVARGELSDDEGDKDEDMELDEIENSNSKEETKEKLVAAGRPERNMESRNMESSSGKNNDKSDKENKEPNDTKEDIKKLDKPSSKEVSSPALNGVISDTEREHESTEVRVSTYTLNISVT